MSEQEERREAIARIIDPMSWGIPEKDRSFLGFSVEPSILKADRILARLSLATTPGVVSENPPGVRFSDVVEQAQEDGTLVKVGFTPARNTSQIGEG